MSTPYREEANLGVLRQIRTNERILDVGCGRGRLGEEMRRRGNTVFGIELDTDAAAVAEQRLDAVYAGDASRPDLLPEDFRQPYDAIVLADVLEHMVDPAGLLRAVTPLLRPDGRIIVSLPNVACWQMRLRLLMGDFTYGDRGVLDRTHLRFFTRKSARGLLEQCGFNITKEDVTPLLARAAMPIVDLVKPQRGQSELMDSPLYQVYARHIEPLEARVARLWPKMLAFQVILVGRAMSERAQ